MAISLFALVQHNKDSVFSRQPDTLDKVVISGDKLYTSLRDGNLITAGSQYLCVPDLPQQCVLDGQTFDLKFGVDHLTGDVDGVKSELIAGGLTTLSDGLSRMCTKYNTCMFTLSGNTCAIICKDGKYAVVDSHARSADGMIDGAGQSVVLYFSSLQHVFEHFSKFASFLQQTPNLFEICGVSVICSSEKSTLSLGASAAVECREGNITAPTEDTSVAQVVCAVAEIGKKRKLNIKNKTSKKAKTNHNEVYSGVIIVGDVARTNLKFHPLSKDVALALCKKFNIESTRVDATSSAVGPLGIP